MAQKRHERDCTPLPWDYTVCINRNKRGIHCFLYDNWYKMVARLFCLKKVVL